MPVMWVMLAGELAGLHQPTGEHRVERVRRSASSLPEPENAGDADKAAQGNAGGDISQIIGTGAFERQPAVFLGDTALGWDWNRAATGEILTG